MSGFNNAAASSAVLDGLRAAGFEDGVDFRADELPEGGLSPQASAWFNANFASLMLSGYRAGTDPVNN